MRRCGYGNTRNDSRRGCHFVFGFRGRKRIQLHQPCNRGGRPDCALRLDVDSTHSLPQQRSAGRNLITAFFSVNYRHATFPRTARAGLAGRTPCSIEQPALQHAMQQPLLPHACSKPLKKSTRMAAARHAAIQCRHIDRFAAGDPAGKIPSPWLLAFFLRHAGIRAMPVLICAKITMPARTETAAHGGRPASADGVAAISVLRFPATRRKHPGRAGRSTAPARRSPARTASLRRRHLR